MSLDVFLELDIPVPVTDARSGIFIRENGQKLKITQKEWYERYPDREAVAVHYPDAGETTTVYEGNITHNLSTMASKVKIGDGRTLYQVLWRPDEIGIEKARELVAPLKVCIAELQSYPGEYRQWNPKNGWGDYDGLLRFCADYLSACIRFPDAGVRVSR